MPVQSKTEMANHSKFIQSITRLYHQISSEAQENAQCYQCYKYDINVALPRRIQYRVKETNDD
jgi:hypothetical protein